MNFDLDLLLYSPFYIIHKLLRNCFRREFKEINLGNILDVGCGGKPYESCLFFNNYIGIEIEEFSGDARLEISNKKYDLIFDGTTIPFKDESFDTVICTDTLEHVKEIDCFVYEIVRVLKVNGKLIISAPFFWNLHYEPNDYYRFTKFGLSFLFEKYNIQILKIIPTVGMIGLLHSLFAERVMRFVHIKFHFLPFKLRIFLYQFILFPTAQILYPFAKYEFGRESIIKLGYIAIGKKRSIIS
ncbi:MAG: class I SAM-dependent methyltransferase [Proteobacteria bacterium]|nr:class I SAM-dependent methyltransferase [Pseudomonadota bacterium]